MFLELDSYEEPGGGHIPRGCMIGAALGAALVGYVRTLVEAGDPALLETWGELWSSIGGRGYVCASAPPGTARQSAPGTGRCWS